MAPSVTKILDQASSIIGTIVENWDPDAQTLPDLQYVANGAVPWDGCETLAVSFVRSFTAQGGDLTIEGFTAHPREQFLRASVFDVYLLRCVPDVDTSGTEIVLPSPDQVEESATQILTDAQALTNAIVAGADGCFHLVIEAVNQAGPEGGMGGNVLRIRVL